MTDSMLNKKLTAMAADLANMAGQFTTLGGQLANVQGQLRHLHDLSHDLGHAINTQGDILAAIACAVQHQAGRVDPALVAALDESRAKHAALQAALAAQVPVSTP